MKRKNLKECSCQSDNSNDIYFIIPNVVVCSPHSKNGNYYPPEVLKEACPLYENIPVFLNHSELSQKKIEDKVGFINNVRFDLESGKIKADLNLIKLNDKSKYIYELSKTTPDFISLSHHIDAETDTENNQTIVKKIVNVFSVDIVSIGATTKGLFEEKQLKNSKNLIEEKGNMKKKSKTLKELFEGYIRNPNNSLKNSLEVKKVKKILESSGVDLDATVSQSSSEDTSAMLKSSCSMLIDKFLNKEMELSELLKKLKVVLNSFASIQETMEDGEMEEDEVEESDDEEVEDEEVEESEDEEVEDDEEVVDEEVEDDEEVEEEYEDEDEEDDMLQEAWLKCSQLGVVPNKEEIRAISKIKDRQIMEAFVKAIATKNKSVKTLTPKKYEELTPIQEAGKVMENYVKDIREKRGMLGK